MTIHPREFLVSAGNYNELRAMLVQRRKALGKSQMAIDQESGLQDGYVAKLECGMKRMGPLSLELLLGALRVRLALVPSAATHADFTVSPDVIRVIKNHHAVIGAKGGRIRAVRMSARQRRLSARKAARKRWANWREARAKQAAKAEREAKRQAALEAKAARTALHGALAGA